MTGTNLFAERTNADGNQEYVALLDENQLPALVRGTTVPTSGSYAKGCIFIKSDASSGTKALYENQGTTSSPSFNLIGKIEGSEIDANAVSQSQLNYETADVTVSSGDTTGTATVTTGSIILGYYPTSNQDQFVDSISISGTTLTITLGAAATANNVFKVVLLKA